MGNEQDARPGVNGGPMGGGVRRAPPVPPEIGPPRPAVEVLAAEPAQPAPGVAENYAYWQRHGSAWADEYDARKRRQPRYHIQELMLNEYARAHAPARVLEFGCGVGRHLRHLSRVPGLEVFGYDQSQAMVAGALRWTGREWLESHVRVGPPTGRLPYGDGAFDLVYTSEVLVHVRPEDLGGVLGELARVCRGHLLHLEPAPSYQVDPLAHDGCWNHDLPGEYARLGLEAEVLTPGYASQTPVRVAVGAPARFTWSPLTLELYRRLEQDLNDGFARFEARVRELNRRIRENRARAEERADRLTARREELKAEVKDLRAGRSQRAPQTPDAQGEAGVLRERVRELERSVAQLQASLSRQIVLAREQAEDLQAKRLADRREAATLAAERALLLERLSKVLRR